MFKRVDESTVGDDKKKGFSGLSSLESDIKHIPSNARSQTLQRNKAAAAGSSKNRSQPQSPGTTPTPRPAPQPHTEPEFLGSDASLSQASGSSGNSWFLRLIVVLGILIGGWWVIIDLDEAPGPSMATSNSQPSSSSNYSPPQGSELGASRLEFSKPPEGDNNALTIAQIRWCLREEIRIEVLRPMASTNPQIDQFNSVVADYNRRCASFRYRKGTLVRAQRELERVRPQIIANMTPPWK